MVQNSTPLLYSSVVGIYTCIVTYEEFLAKCQFKVEGKVIINAVAIISILYYRE